MSNSKPINNNNNNNNNRSVCVNSDKLLRSLKKFRINNNDYFIGMSRRTEGNTLRAIIIDLKDNKIFISPEKKFDEIVDKNRLKGNNKLDYWRNIIISSLQKPRNNIELIINDENGKKKELIIKSIKNGFETIIGSIDCCRGPQNAIYLYDKFTTTIEYFMKQSMTNIDANKKLIQTCEESKLLVVEALKIKEENEQNMLRKFVMILNEKKKKIRKQNIEIHRLNAIINGNPSLSLNDEINSNYNGSNSNAVNNKNGHNNNNSNNNNSNNNDNNKDTNPIINNGLNSDNQQRNSNIGTDLSRESIALIHGSNNMDLDIHSDLKLSVDDDIQNSNDKMDNNNNNHGSSKQELSHNNTLSDIIENNDVIDILDDSNDMYGITNMSEIKKSNKKRKKKKRRLVDSQDFADILMNSPPKKKHKTSNNDDISPIIINSNTPPETESFDTNFLV